MLFITLLYGILLTFSFSVVIIVYWHVSIMYKITGLYKIPLFFYLFIKELYDPQFDYDETKLM